MGRSWRIARTTRDVAVRGVEEPLYLSKRRGAPRGAFAGSLELASPLIMEAPIARSVSRTAWLIVALLAPVAMLNYLDRQMLASMKFSVMHDIKDIGKDENWGWMLGQFKWVYAFLSPIGGYVAER